MRLKKPEQLIIILKKFYISGSRFDKAMGIAPTRLAICAFFMVVLESVATAMMNYI
jgi:hypothetical protein